MPKSAYCEFEEKEYETKMNFELAYSRDMIYAPGQVKEHVLGFDAAILSRNPVLWELLPPRRMLAHTLGPNGFTLSPEYWAELDQTLSHFPTMEFNVFLQYKRPRCISRGGSKEWHLWNKPYFRYDIEIAQQTALEKLDMIAGDDALVTYASPCFGTFRELWDFAGASALTANSNFARPSNISGHQAYTYSEAGATGIAHSDPREIDGMPFEDRLGNLRAQRGRIEQRSNGNRSFIKSTAKYVEEAANDSPLKSLYATLSGRLADEEKGALESEVAVAFRRVLLFCTIANASWHIAVDKK